MMFFTRSRSFCFIIFTIVLYFFHPLCAQAQQTVVTIKIVNAKREPLPFASVSVTSVKDSTKAIHKVSDSSGTLTFNLAHEQYLVAVSSVNYAPFQKGITVKSDHPVFTFIAEISSKSLQGVNIVSSRPVMRQEDDKTIIDPENLASSSTNAYEILEKTPGLFVD
ncbi:MAG: carboxypeptidase regulatory-like domain-containing protein, partial [Ginsengibacter sp.]